MRVVSLVPSWTETLLAAGVNVVGRTRFCVHPAALVAGIPVVGGTKDLREEELRALAPDLVIVDKEENLPFMAEAGGEAWRVHITHVRAADDLPGELTALAGLLNNEYLQSLAAEWREELAHPHYPDRRAKDFPGVTDWIQRPVTEPTLILYLIWRGPWMAVAADTFVGSLITHLGYGARLPKFTEKYPKVDLGDFDPEKTLLLFSTEPYPFGGKRAELAALGFPAALVDGEAFSWFGVRSLAFLRRLRGGETGIL